MRKIVLVFTLFLFASNVLFAQEEGGAQGEGTKEEAVATKEVAATVQESHEEIHLNWEKYFKSALTKSKREKKPILVFFTGSDWCGPCKKLHKGVFETARFKKYADEYFILYQADFPRNKDLVSRQNKGFNEQLKKRFKQESFPTVLVIDDNGNSLGQRNGLYDFDSYYPFFEEIIEKIKNK